MCEYGSKIENEAIVQLLVHYFIQRLYKRYPSAYILPLRQLNQKLQSSTLSIFNRNTTFM